MIFLFWSTVTIPHRFPGGYYKPHGQTDGWIGFVSDGIHPSDGHIYAIHLPFPREAGGPDLPPQVHVMTGSETDILKWSDHQATWLCLEV